MVLATVSGIELPDYFPTMAAAVVLVSALAAFLMLLGYKVIDKITPGKLCEELLGSFVKKDLMMKGKGVGAPDQKIGTRLKMEKAPNVALAIVVGSMFLGGSIIIGATVIGVLLH